MDESVAWFMRRLSSSDKMWEEISGYMETRAIGADAFLPWCIGRESWLLRSTIIFLPLTYRTYVALELAARKIGIIMLSIMPIMDASTRRTTQSFSNAFAKLSRLYVLSVGVASRRTMVVEIFWSSALLYRLSQQIALAISLKRVMHLHRIRSPDHTMLIFLTIHRMALVHPIKHESKIPVFSQLPTTAGLNSTCGDRIFSVYRTGQAHNHYAASIVIIVVAERL